MRYGTEVTGFDVDGGRLRGVGVNGNGTISCGAAALACGGFESSAALRDRFLGHSWGDVKVRGTRFNTGELLLAAVEAGAGQAGDWSECHATPIGADSADFGDLDLGAATNRLSYPYGVMVDLEGDRFADEGEDFKLYTYAKMGVEIMRQPHGLALQLFDAKATPLLEERYVHTVPFQADTLDGLAAELERVYGDRGLKAPSVLRTVDAYNAACGDGTFDPIALDGVRTHGLAPDKTNWARPLDTAAVHGVSGDGRDHVHLRRRARRARRERASRRRAADRGTLRVGGGDRRLLLRELSGRRGPDARRRLRAARGRGRSPRRPRPVSGFTAALADRVAEAPPPPAHAVEAARQLFLDTTGVMLAGAVEPAAGKVRAVVRAEGGEPLALVVGTRLRTSIAGAALANGTAAHALDLDDSHHPGFLHRRPCSCRPCSRSARRAARAGPRPWPRTSPAAARR